MKSFLKFNKCTFVTLFESKQSLDWPLLEVIKRPVFNVFYMYDFFITYYNCTSNYL